MPEQLFGALTLEITEVICLSPMDLISQLITFYFACQKVFHYGNANKNFRMNFACWGPEMHPLGALKTPAISKCSMFFNHN